MTPEANEHGVLGPHVAGLDELGALLRDARAAKGLEIGDVAELTHVRREYLRALEEGRYSDLPEDVYTRNFVRLFAQAVGVPAEEALGVYQRARQRAGGLSTLEERLEQERRGEPPARPARRKEARGGVAPRLGPAMPTLLLVVALVALAVWGYNALFFRAGRTPQGPTTASSEAPQAAAAPAPSGLAAPAPSGLAAPAGEGERSDLPVGGTVLLDVFTDPAGAQVAVDGFVLPGYTPIRAAPVTARADRRLRVTLEGYETVEQAIDLSDSRTVELALVPLPTAPSEDADTPVPGSSEIVIHIKALSWLEVYRGTARNEGERLVYTTAAPGETYRFSLPVYVHAGNAAGVEVTLGDGAPFTLGSSGAVVGRAFQAP